MCKQNTPPHCKCGDINGVDNGGGNVPAASCRAPQQLESNSVVEDRETGKNKNENRNTKEKKKGKAKKHSATVSDEPFGTAASDIASPDSRMSTQMKIRPDKNRTNV